MAQNHPPKIEHLIRCGMEMATVCHTRRISPAILLLAILNDDGSEARKCIMEMNVDIEALRTELQETVKPSDADRIVNGTEYYTTDTETQRILFLTQLEARLSHDNEVTDLHFLRAILRDTSNAASKALGHQGIFYEKVAGNIHDSNAPSTSISLPFDTAGRESEPNSEKEGVGSGQPSRFSPDQKESKAKGDTPVIDNFGTDLTQAARDGVLDPIVGRSGEIERTAQILSRRKKNNPILIGEPGVGKSALVEGLAQRIVEGNVPHTISNKRIVALDMASLVAGTQYRGQFEERLRRLIDELKDHREIILFIDEIHTIIGAGGAPGSLDAANILKPALARGEIQCIGATTINEFRKTIEKDGALDRRFQRITLEPTSAEDTITILKNIKDRYEDHHHVTYTPDAINACVNLAERYITDRALPDKAIDALDEAGSRKHMQNAHVPEGITEKLRDIKNLGTLKEAAVENKDFQTATSLHEKLKATEEELAAMERQWEADLDANRLVIDYDDIAQVISSMSGVPAERVQEDESTRLRGLKQALANKVISQDRAITRLCRAITRNRLGLKDPNRPIGTFMFVGPTGVGKTHLVKTLAEHLFGRKDALIRIDMSEYGEKFSVSRLVGAPPGYVGYEEGGQLTEKVRRHPYSIVLLDEIEKAHPDVFNTLLQVMDEGRLTDGNGVTVDFRNTIIILTSNSGSRQLKDFGAGIGFDVPTGALQADVAEDIVRKALRKQFAPEFLNRLDDIIMFDPLNEESVRQIARLEIQLLGKRMADSGYHITFTDKAIELLARKGYDPQYGARALKRTIQELVEDPICDMLLDGTQQGTAFDVDVKAEDPEHLAITALLNDTSQQPNAASSDIQDHTNDMTLM